MGIDPPPREPRVPPPEEPRKKDQDDTAQAKPDPVARRQGSWGHTHCREGDCPTQVRDAVDPIGPGRLPELRLLRRHAPVSSTGEPRKAAHRPLPHLLHEFTRHDGDFAHTRMALHCPYHHPPGETGNVFQSLLRLKGPRECPPPCYTEDLLLRELDGTPPERPPLISTGRILRQVGAVRGIGAA